MAKDSSSNWLGYFLIPSFTLKSHSIYHYVKSSCLFMSSLFQLSVSSSAISAPRSFTYLGMVPGTEWVSNEYLLNESMRHWATANLFQTAGLGPHHHSVTRHRYTWPRIPATESGFESLWPLRVISLFHA